MLPANLDPAIAALAEPLACCINGQEQACVCRGDRVLICGGGPIGALHALLAELKGASRIVVAEKLPGRVRELQRHTSATVINPVEEPLSSALAEQACVSNVDVILTATPDVRVDGSLLRMLGSGGRICIFSGPKSGNYEEQINFRSIHYHELTITGSYGCSSRHNRLAAKLLTAGLIKADWIVTKRTNLAGIKDSFSHSSERIGLKSVVCGI
jgi:L-iditol 2-dehydrogenase